MHKNGAIALFAVALSWLPVCGVKAAGFEVRPITIETHDGLGLVVVTNQGDQRIYLESHVLDWSQDALGVERLDESDAALASPPAMWVPPHTSYTMRIMLPAASGDRERAFRVILKQLPERNDVVAGRIVFALTQNLPAFVEPASLTPPAVTARMLDARHIIIQNSGGRRVRVSNVRQDGVTIAPGLVGYALARGALAVALPHPIHNGNIDLETDLGPRSIVLR